MPGWPSEWVRDSNRHLASMGKMDVETPGTDRSNWDEGSREGGKRRRAREAQGARSVGIYGW